jgi:isocitrate lyase
MPLLAGKPVVPSATHIRRLVPVTAFDRAAAEDADSILVVLRTSSEVSDFQDVQPGLRLLAA